MSARLKLGAPGVYEVPPEPVFALTGERMDVCAFAGVAPRGPAYRPYFQQDWAERPCLPGDTHRRTVPVPVESWSEYLQRFGGFEGPGLLPYAVASFFENGGRRAYVLRVVHDFGGADPGLSRGALQGLTTTGGQPVALRAQDPGQWGNRLSATLSFRTFALPLDDAGTGLWALELPRDAQVPAGTVLRLRLEGGGRELRLLTRVDRAWTPEAGRTVLRASLDRPLPRLPVAAEVVEGVLEIQDGDERIARGGRYERLESLGLSALHPRWLARALALESTLLLPDERPGSREWMDGDLALLVDLQPYATAAFTGGEDHYQDIVPEDFFSDWLPGDECPGDGVHAVADLGEVALLCAPDLYSPGPLVEEEVVVEPPSVAGAEFRPCVPIAPPPLQESRPGSLDGLRLDPATDLDAIAALQGRLVELAEQLQRLIVLLDVPPGLSQRRILRWRSRFTSAYVAAYHPWLTVSRADDRRDALVRVPPAPVAAGIIADRERVVGLPHGPANVLAGGVVAVVERVSPARHDELHPQGINVYLQERDGVRLTAARTLSLDPSFRQLSVRRLVSMLRRALDRQMQWAVFEPNGLKLRADLTIALQSFLRQLYRLGAFRGATEAEAFFVRCDDSNNPQRVTDLGQLHCDIGVAPTEPLEFIVLTIVREGDGTIRVGG